MSGSSIPGIVLAGGRSRRMGGSDKAFVELAGRPLLAHVLERLAPQCEGLVLSHNGDADRFAMFGVPVVADDIPGFSGPLAGLVAALDWIALNQPDCAAAVSCAVDTPFVPRDFVERLCAGGAGPACAVSGGRRHPVAALWPVGARHEARRALASGDRRVAALIERLGARDVVWESEPVDPFFNLNTPDDLAWAHRVAADAA